MPCKQPSWSGQKGHGHTLRSQICSLDSFLVSRFQDSLNRSQQPWRACLDSRGPASVYLLHGRYNLRVWRSIRRPSKCSRYKQCPLTWLLQLYSSLRLEPLLSSWPFTYTLAMVASLDASLSCPWRYRCPLCFRLLERCRTNSLRCNKNNGLLRMELYPCYCCLYHYSQSNP